MTLMKPPPMEAIVHFEVHRFGAFLSTRSTAAKVREELEQAVRAVRDAQRVDVDFSGVEAITISFADEFIGRFMTARAAGDVGDVAVVVTGLNGEVEEALSICLERRDAIATARAKDGFWLLGGDQIQETTFESLVQRGVSTASDLATELSITPQNANNRLKRLTAFGVVRRQKEAPQTGGREFVYVAPSELEPAPASRPGPRVKAGAQSSTRSTGKVLASDSASAQKRKTGRSSGP